MSTLWFLGDWALRGAALALAAGAVLRICRVRDVSTKLAAWNAVLLTSLLVPLLLAVTPPLFHAAAVANETAVANVKYTVVAAAPTAVPVPAATPTKVIDYGQLALVAYAVVCFGMLLRLAVGLWMARRLVKSARPMGEPGVFESDEIRIPVTMGLLRPSILLPSGWRQWSDATREGVLAHERSHVRRQDTLFQLVSAIHRCVLWFSPVAWWLHGTIARLAEDASDDRALAATGDPASYAETLLSFVRRAPARVLWSGVAMARTAKAERRIDRILSGHVPSAGLRKPALAAIVVVALAGAYLAAAAQVAPPPPPVPPVPAIAPMAPPAPQAPAIASEPPSPPEPLEPGTTPMAPQPPAPPAPVIDSEEALAIVREGKSYMVNVGPNDHKRIQVLQARHKAFLWKRDQKGEHLITDPATVDQIANVIDKANQAGEMQAHLGSLQAEFGEQQAEIARQMAEASRQFSQANMAEVERSMREAGRVMKDADLQQVEKAFQEVQEQMKRNDGVLGVKETQLKEMQKQLEKAQKVLEKQQAEFSREQEHRMQKVQENVQQLLEEAAKKGLVQRP